MRVGFRRLQLVPNHALTGYQSPIVITLLIFPSSSFRRYPHPTVPFGNRFQIPYGPLCWKCRGVALCGVVDGMRQLGASTPDTPLLA